MQENIKNQLNNNSLEYRNKLTIPGNVRFGLEIELEAVSPNKVYELVRQQFGTSFKVKEDISLMRHCSAEVVTPVLRNQRQYLETLRKLALLLSKLEPTFDNCSFQVNFDGYLLPTLQDKIRFLKLYGYYEDIIYRFSRGDDSSYRETIDMYAGPIILTLKDMIRYEKEDSDFLLEKFKDNKRYGIIFKTEKDLIEFRTPNGTVNPILWQNYVTFFYYLIMLSKGKWYDEQEIDEYIGSYKNLDPLGSYERLREEKAVSLSKKMFNNQVDRVNFLHQYLGKKR